MNELDVRIVELKPLRVACVNAYSESPEQDSWLKMEAWAKPKGLLDAPGLRVFGYNNPNPSPGTPNYGYDFWITVAPQVQAEGEVSIIDFPGGLYAVTRVKGIEGIHETWKQLVAWLEESKYQHGSHQWLEEHLTSMDTPFEDFLLDLYAPITE
jgi:DNA gyrase inhibitor GyrI